MASTSTQPAPSTSSSTDSQEYDVFLSFRGVDTRHTFADALYHAMKNKGIMVFRDKEDLEVGEEINPALTFAIKESRYAVVVISPQFAKSKACLLELSMIMTCTRMKRLKVFPIFYHVNPSEVEDLMKDVESNFTKPEDYPEAAKAKWENWKSLLGNVGDCSVDPELDKDLQESCRRALKEASNLSAVVVGKDSYKTEVAQEISVKIFSKVVTNSPHISKCLVGIEFRVSAIMKLLDIKGKLREKEVDPVRVIGICGIGGIGKTTLAEVIYNKVSPQFSRCIIYQIGKKTEHHDLVYFQKKLISNILGNDVGRSLDDDYKVKEVLRTKLRGKEVFIVLDDVWDKVQVETLVGNLEWFGPGSRILITSRDHCLLRLSHLKDNAYVYEVMELDSKDALELFCWKAFNQPHPREDFEKVTHEIVHRAQGLPFALDAFGSYLSGTNDKGEWNAYRNELHKNLEGNVCTTLEKSFDALIVSGQVCYPKELFLDIACFFSGCFKNNIIPILEALGYNPTYHLGVLKDKSLLRISNDGQLMMHDFLVELGQQVARSNRLLQTEDLITALSSDTMSPEENRKVEGIVLKLPLPDNEQINLEALSAMVNLRVLRITYKTLENVKWYGDLSNFKLSSKRLCVMEWWRCPLQSLSIDSNTKLVELKLPFSHIQQLWVGQKMFSNLRSMKLRGSENLIELPNFRGIPNLEILDVSNCICLHKVDMSLGLLKKLRELCCGGCVHLGQCSEVLRECLSSLSALQKLDLTSCGLLDVAIPSDLSGLGSLKSLLLGGNNFKRIPESICQLSALEVLLFKGGNSYIWGGWQSYECMLPQPKLQLSGLRCLRELDLSYLNLPDGVLTNDIRCLSSLEYLCLDGNDFEKIPDVLYELSNLCKLYLNNVPRLKTLPKLPLSLVEMELSNCRLLEMSYNLQAMWNSSKILHTTDCSLLVASIGYDCKPSKMLHLHPQSPLCTTFKWQSQSFEVAVACGPFWEVGIPKWCKERIISFSRAIESPYFDLDDDLQNLRGFTIFIVYQVYDNSTSPLFVCQVDDNVYHERVPLVFCVPESPLGGPNGVWAYIPVTWLRKQLKIFNNDHNLCISITISSLNVNLKEYGTRLVYERDLPKFYDVLTSISAHGVNSRSVEEFFSGMKSLSCSGSIKARAIF